MKNVAIEKKLRGTDVIHVKPMGVKDIFGGNGSSVARLASYVLLFPLPKATSASVLLRICVYVMFRCSLPWDDALFGDMNPAKQLCDVWWMMSTLMPTFCRPLNSHVARLPRLTEWKSDILLEFVSYRIYL